jgi:excisionase family DNA binding protein
MEYSVPDTDHGPVTLDDLRGRAFATVEEAAKILDLDRRTVRSAINAGTIPGVRAGSTYRVPTAWLLQAAGVPE